MTIFPRKRFGQNFLRNSSIAEKIIENLQITKEDTIVEIGPGKGILSRSIVKREFFRYFAIEIDQRFITELNEYFYRNEKANLIIGDIQNFSFAKYSEINNCRIKIVGNIPYNITSPIMFYLLDNHRIFKEAIIMIQREVADRLLALPMTKEYGILSVLTGIQAELELICHVKANNFYPVPKVDSTVIKFNFYEDIDGVDNLEKFRKIIRGCFQMRRKTLKNNLASLLGKESTDKIKAINLAKRPEELTVNEFKILVNEIESIEK